MSVQKVSNLLTSKGDIISENSLIDDFNNKNVINEALNKSSYNQINSVLSTRDTINTLIDEMEALTKWVFHFSYFFVINEL